jgi:nucleotide-binding universal stress UspA family protein
MFKQILLAIDLGEESSWSKALPAALKLVRDHEAQLHVMTVVPDFGFSVVGQYFPKDYEHKMLEDMRRRLREFVTTHVPKDVPVRDIIGHGAIYSEILEAAESVKADLIVLSSHRPGLQDYLIGPNASKVVRHAKCSVLVVRE